MMNIFASLLVSNMAMAETGRTYKIVSKRASDAGGGGTNSSKAGATITQASSETILPDRSKATQVRECKLDQGESEYIPLEMYETLTKHGEPLEISIKDNNLVEVKLNRYLVACGKVIPELEQNPVTLDVMVLLKIQKDGKTLKYSEYLNCLEEKKFVKDEALDHSGIADSNYSSLAYTLPFNFDRQKDIQKTAKVTFGYPYAFSDPVTGYGAKNGFVSQDIVPGSNCMLEEKIASEPVYINKGRDVLLAEIEAICNSGNLDNLKDVLRSLGNMEALRGDMENVRHQLSMRLLESALAESEKYMKQMEKIEDKINTSKSEMTEQEARKEINKYVELVKKLDETYLNPAITVLDQLMTERQALIDATEDEDTIAADLARFDKQIAELNNGIAAFSERNQTAHANIYSMMQKYALNDAAKKVEDVRLKSHFFARVNAGGGDQTRGKPITVETANKEHQKRSKNFTKTLNEWKDVYLVSKGNMEPIHRVERERTQAITRMNSRYQKMEEGLMKDYQSSCKVGMLGTLQNQAKCQRFLGTVQKKREQELRRREKDLYYIKAKNTTLDKMGMSYNDYQNQMAKRELAGEDGYASYGSSGEYHDYDASYSDLYPLYDGPTGGTAYGGNMFSFGQQDPQQQMMGAMGGMGQQPMTLQAPSMMQNYQGQQGGGWANF